MGFFNSLSIRISLALIGGILYSILTYSIVTFLDLSPKFAIPASLIVFLFYVGSRLLILFSGMDTLYYSKGGRTPSKSFYEGTLFYQTAQWVGKFYHYHDILLFVFLALLSITFLITLIMDWSRNKPFFDAFQNIWNSISSSF